MSKPRYCNIIFTNQQNEVLAMLYDDEIISKREYKIITEENFLGRLYNQLEQKIK